MVLQKANATLTTNSKENNEFRRHVGLLKMFDAGKLKILWSLKLVQEYRNNIKKPRNEYVQLFIALLDDPQRSQLNWTKLSGSQKDDARKCRFPNEDGHLLRTAFIPNSRTTLFTEEGRVLKTADCTKRHFRVGIVDPRKDIAPFKGNLVKQTTT